MPLGALIGGGLSLLGGAMSNRRNRASERRQEALQREFAQHGVRWRVEDAKAAGLHPLAALGMQSVPYSPVSFADSMGPALSEAGQSIGRAVSATRTGSQREAELLGLQLLKSQIAETDARREFVLSEAARNLQEMNQAKTFPVDDWWSDNFGVSGSDVARSTEGVVLPEAVNRSGYVVNKPPTVFENTSGDLATGAGESPFWRQFRLRPDMSIVLPGGMSGDPAEALEAVSESAVLMAMVIEENVNRYGPEWLTKFNRMRGQKERGEPFWRRPGAWLGGKIADLRDRASRGGQYKRFR